MRISAPAAATALFAALAVAQNAPAPGTAPDSQQPAASPAPAGPAVPDYPDPRTLTIGAFYWLTNQGQGTNPNIYDGRGYTSEESLPNLGNYHAAPTVEASYPVTRTGVLYLQASEIKGAGNEINKITTFPLGLSSSFNPGDYLDTQFQIRDVHLFLDDLLYPHKFPVRRLRFKSLWGFEYFSIHGTATTSKATSPLIADDTRNIFAPTFGAAAEYAISKHVLLRISGSAWGLYHRNDIEHAEGTLSWRRGPVEIVAGEKLVHFKTSPNNANGYIAGTLIGAFAGLRWHI